MLSDGDCIEEPDTVLFRSEILQVLNIDADI